MTRQDALDLAALTPTIAATIAAMLVFAAAETVEHLFEHAATWTARRQ